LLPGSSRSVPGTEFVLKSLVLMLKYHYTPSLLSLSSFILSVKFTVENLTQVNFTVSF
jgi:hypothetical protein